MSMSINLKSKKFPILYGLSSKGTVKQWSVFVQEFIDHSTIIIEHGQLGGKIQTATEKVHKGKNIGKANETTPFEQACLQAESKWKKQHDKNYSEKAPELVEGTTEPVDSSVGGTKLLPMLAQKYNERKKYLVWPVFVQSKLNGVRCLVERKGNKIFYWSRKAKQYKNFNLYMDPEFLSFMEDGEILDGEMYNHGDITFQELISLIKDEKNPDLDSLKKYVKFWHYDRPSGKGGFKDRYLKWRLENRPVDSTYIKLVDTYLVDNEDMLLRKHRIFMADGYEGTIVRSGGDEPYNFQYRDNQLQKYKDFIDAEFPIVGCKEGKGKDEGTAIFRCQSKSRTGGSYEDGTFDVRCKGTYTKRRKQWQDWKHFVGEPLTVRYQTLSDEGIPIFPVGIAVRDYE